MTDTDACLAFALSESTGPLRLERAMAEIERLSNEFGEQLLKGEEHELFSRLYTYMETAPPSKDVVNNLKEFVLQCLNHTTNRIQDTWSDLSVQESNVKKLNKHVEQMKEGISDLLADFYRQTLEVPEWTPFRSDLYHAINDILLALIPLLKANPHHPNKLLQTIRHYAVKKFLGGVSLYVWTVLLVYYKPTDEEVLLDLEFTFEDLEMPLDLIVPTMRRLGMLDILDPEWDMHGCWAEICDTFKRGTRRPLIKTIADTVLEEKSLAWRAARYSMMCRSMAVRPRFGVSQGADECCFKYYPKCTAKLCTNVETAKKPHPFRCHRCWYFHCCSKACNEHAEAFRQHNCELVTSEKAAVIKSQMNEHLGPNSIDNEQSSDDDEERCSFCSSRQSNLSKELLKCSRCKNALYCSRDCQAWDWEHHRAECTGK